ncbi:MAG: hypothetical protein ACYDAY_09920 [Candidatus Dormibacteria bacterium]
MLKAVKRAVKVAVIGLTVAAVYQELKLPSEERTWHGRVAGVPYDFRIPTLERLREAYWNPDEERIFTDKVLGLGWSVNVYRLLELARGATAGETYR